MKKEDALSTISDLVIKYQKYQNTYESSGYLERQLQTDFLDDFFKAMGWDVTNKSNLPMHLREVLVEKGDTVGRPDYTFRIKGDDVFFVEVKSPSRGTERDEDIFQTKRYGWSTRRVSVSILTDFKTLKVFDTTIKPRIDRPKLGLLFDSNILDNIKDDFEKIWLFSKELVKKGSIANLILENPVSSRLRIPVDIDFLNNLTQWREALAKNYYKNNPELNVRLLNEIVQKLLDRLIFIRLLEDRDIIRQRSLFSISENWKVSQHRDLQMNLNFLFSQLNRDFNGEIFKFHPCESYFYNSKIISDIIDELYPPISPYDFSVIGVELLGTIYERYLGKTIRLTPKRVIVEDKPEVRKAGGVYYTPKWVVQSIVNETVGNLIDSKSPDEISKIRILDPACGSGSFLIEALNNLFEYHLNYYLNNSSEAKEGTLFPNITRIFNEPRLSIYAKSRILQNNIFGVDLDPQAVEITMMSLYIKILEGERTLPHNKELLPSLEENIRCGNSLIGFDFYEQITLDKENDIEKVNAFDWKSNQTGFGEIFDISGGFNAIIGNPPYVKSILLRNDPKTWEYYRKKYQTVYREFDLYLCFLEKSYQLLAPNGCLGFIMPNKWLHAKMGRAARSYFLDNTAIKSVVNFHSFQVFDKATTYTMLIFLKKSKKETIDVYNYIGSPDNKKLLLNYDESSEWEKGDVQYDTLTDSPWNFITGDAKHIINKINHLPKIEEYFTLAKGTGTCVDPVFYVQKLSETKEQYKIYSKYTKKEHNLEKTYLKPSAKGKDIDSYRILDDNQLLIYPYKNRTLIERIEIQKNSPNLWAYLEECKDKLEKRERGRWKGNKFFCYGRPQNHDKLSNKKILVPAIVKKAKAAWDSKGLHVIDSVYFVKRQKESNLSEMYILALLNSKLLTYFLMKTSSNLRGGYFSMKPGYLNEFPLKASIETKQEKEQYERIINLVKRINKISSVESNAAKREIITLKEKIDNLIYILYGLSDKEKNIIDNVINLI